MTNCFTGEEKVFIGPPWSKHVPNGSKMISEEVFWSKMVSWDGLWGVSGKLGVHRASWGIPRGTFG